MVSQRSIATARHDTDIASSRAITPCAIGPIVSHTWVSENDIVFLPWSLQHEADRYLEDDPHRLLILIARRPEAPLAERLDRRLVEERDRLEHPHVVLDA